MNKNKKLVITAVCIALCYILPIVFHSAGLGTVLSPMHIPVLLCGLVCGGWYGAVCGIVGPLLSSVLSGMPGPAMLVSMVPELGVYGLACGLLMKLVHTRHLLADLYICQTSAMLAGRIVGGIAKALFYTGGGAYSFGLWISGYFVTSAPGILCHLVVVPLLVVVLSKARLIPNRYPKGT